MKSAYSDPFEVVRSWNAPKLPILAKLIHCHASIWLAADVVTDVTDQWLMIRRDPGQEQTRHH